MPACSPRSVTNRNRFADARSLKAYARSAPVTRASGRSLSVTHRRVKNNRLAAAGFVSAFVAATHSPGPARSTTPVDEPGDRHAAALHNVFNRLVRLYVPLPTDRPDLQGGHSIASFQQAA